MSDRNIEADFLKDVSAHVMRVIRDDVFAHAVRGLV